MIAQIKINVGSVIVNVSTAFRKAEVAAAREQLMNLVGSAFDRHVADAKQQWKGRATKRDKAPRGK